MAPRILAIAMVLVLAGCCSSNPTCRVADVTVQHLFHADSVMCTNRQCTSFIAVYDHGPIVRCTPDGCSEVKAK